MPVVANQLPLFAKTTQTGFDSGGTDGLPGRFRKVYYHLYSNSNSSRAESLLADLSLLLLAKLCEETAPDKIDMSGFLEGTSSANNSLLRGLRNVYPALVDPHDAFRTNEDALRHALSELRDVRLYESAAHVLGEAFQALIGPRIRGDKGQFFTPRSLVRAMVSILDPQPGETILDPACGTGGFLYEALAHVERNGGRPAALHGADKDKDLARFAAALLAHRASDTDIHNINSLSVDDWDNAALGAQYDVVLTNPPFGTKIPITDPSVLRHYDLAHDWQFDAPGCSWRKTSLLGPTQDPQILFLELCIRKLRKGGRMGIVLPEGMFGNKQQAYVWDFVRQHGQITALLDCPRTTFQPGTDTKTNILFFRKGAPATRSTVAVAVAINCGHDRRGRTQRTNGEAHPDDFPAIGESLRLARRGKAVVRGCMWQQVTVTNPYYLVPRYYVEELPTEGDELSIVSSATWKTIGELRDAGVIDVRKGHEVGSEAYGTGDIPFVRTSDITNFEVATDPTKSVSDEIYEQFRLQQRLKAGAILMVVDGRYRIGATAILTEQSAQCVVQSHLRIIDLPQPEKLDPYALLFALNLPSVRRRIRDLVFIQSTLGTLGARLFELKVPVLSGFGPWCNVVAQFKTNLQRRAALLTELDAMIGHDCDL